VKGRQGEKRFISGWIVTLVILGGISLWVTTSSKKRLDESSRAISKKSEDRSELEYPIWSWLLVDNRGLATDLLWVEVLIYYGDQLRTGEGYGELQTFAKRIVENDPYFKPIYSWFPPIYALKNFPPDRQQLEFIAELGDSALEKYPNAWQIQFMIGAIFAYYGTSQNRATRIWKLEKALYFFGKATSIPESASYLEQTMTQLQGRLDETIRRRDGEKIASRRSYHGFVDSAFLGESYFSTLNRDWRQYLRSRLRHKGLEKQVISEPLDVMRENYRERRTRHLGFLPPQLWSEVVSYSQFGISSVYAYDR
jgi:hypothetical protein